MDPRPFKDAGAQTLSDVGGFRGCAFNAGSAVAGALCGAMLNGPIGAAVGGFLGITTPLAGLYLFNLYWAEASFWKQKALAAEQALAALTSITPAGPDWEIKSLLDHVIDNKPIIASKRHLALWSATSEVRDACSIRGLKIWGRQTHDHEMSAGLRMPTGVIEEIRAAYWKTADFNPETVSVDGDSWEIQTIDVRTSAIELAIAKASRNGVAVYMDLQVNKEQALKLWPIKQQ